MSFVPNPKKIAEDVVTQHIADVDHGTTTAEQTILTDFETHLDPLERNPHGLTPNDLDVYTKDQVDTLVGPVQIFNCGGFV